jgi:hypothetical protein
MDGHNHRPLSEIVKGYYNSTRLLQKAFGGEQYVDERRLRVSQAEYISWKKFLELKYGDRFEGLIGMATHVAECAIGEGKGNTSVAYSVLPEKLLEHIDVHPDMSRSEKEFFRDTYTLAARVVYGQEL